MYPHPPDPHITKFKRVGKKPRMKVQSGPFLNVLLRWIHIVIYLFILFIDGGVFL